MVGEGEPNFEQIRPGDTRPRVESILGQREWQLGYANGLTYEIYQFKAGRPPDPLLGTAAYAFDFVTLGLLEIGYRPNQLAPVKQIAVAYDANGHGAPSPSLGRSRHLALARGCALRYQLTLVFLLLLKRVKKTNRSAQVPHQHD